MAHILIVEDAPDNRTIAELILQNAGHTVVSVGDGASAVCVAVIKYVPLLNGAVTWIW